MSDQAEYERDPQPDVDLDVPPAKRDDLDRHTDWEPLKEKLRPKKRPPDEPADEPDEADGR